jgi:hypothetical protein
MMSDNTVSESQTKEMEVSIIRAFATAIIEFEPVLYQKFLLQTRGLITEEMFKQTLANMEEKGFVAPLKFQGRQCWRRLASEDDVTAEYHDQEEVREIIERSQTLAIQKKRVPEEGVPFVSQIRRTAQEVLDLVKSQIPESHESDKAVREKLRYHFESMRQTLADSEDDFLKYLLENMPSLHDAMRDILNSKGVDILLPALRIVESGFLDPNA